MCHSLGSMHEITSTTGSPSCCHLCLIGSATNVQSGATTSALFRKSDRTKRISIRASVVEVISHTFLKLLFVGLLSIIITACTASPGTESTGEFFDSSTTTAKVKTSLVNQLGTTGLTIQVKTFKDEVQLSGFVATPGLKQRAGIVAAGVDGVRKVRNDLIVRS